MEYDVICGWPLKAPGASGGPEDPPPETSNSSMAQGPGPLQGKNIFFISRGPTPLDLGSRGPLQMKKVESKSIYQGIVKILVTNEK